MAFALLVGILTAADYGETADDLSLLEYAEHTQTVYTCLITEGRLIDPNIDILANYGPSFLMFSQIGRGLLQAIDPGIDWFFSWHFFIFLSYLIGVAAFYGLVTRFFEQPVALAASLLFATQPVLWGQGFLNAKDTPLMAFMLLAVFLGVRLERLAPKGSWDFSAFRSTVLADWQAIPLSRRQRWLVRARRLGWVALGLLLFSMLWRPVLTALLGWLLSLSPETWLGGSIAQLAPHAGELPLAGYVDKALLYLRWATFLPLGLLLLGGFVYLAAHLRRLQAIFWRWLSRGMWQGGAGYWRSGALWMAATALGLATSIRVIGPMAGVVVLVYLLWRRGPQVLALAIPYALGAMLATYLLWPLLWPDPLGGLADSIRLMSAFPWAGRVLFNGDLIHATRLPASYLPTLLAIQLTLPALVLILAGVWLAFTARYREQRALLAAMAVWFLVPLVYIVWQRPTIYHNFRQFLFMVPPLFVMAAFALDRLWGLVRSHRLFALVALVAVLPALVANVQLHPYEYVYYNALVGGVPGAEGRFELEYWGSSLTEATRRLNSIAPVDSLVVAWGNVQIVEHVARPDLRVEPVNARLYDAGRGYDYVLVPIRAGRGRYFFAGFPEAVVVERQGVALAVVNQLNCDCATFDPNQPDDE